MIDYAGQIKEAVSCRTFAEAIGLKINRAGFTICPFHGDHDASLKIYSDERKGWCCFGCHRGGDVISFAMQYYGVGFRDALTRLDNDFNLEILPKGGDMRSDASAGALGAVTVAARRAARHKQERLREALQAEYGIVYDKWLECDRIIQGFRPTDRDAEFPKRVADAFWARPFLEDRLNEIEGAIIYHDHPEFRGSTGDSGL